MSRSERLVKLLGLLHTGTGMETDALARACGVSERTVRRDLDALTRAGFPVYFDHGHRLAAPPLLPAITLTVDEALALRLAAQGAARGSDSAAAQALTLATEKLQQALATKPPEASSDRQLALALSVRDPRADAVMAALTAAIGERRTVQVTYVPPRRRGNPSGRLDPYRLLPSPAGWTLLAYCHDRRRFMRIPVARLGEMRVTRRRFRSVPARVLERHLHRGPPVPPEPLRIRLACRPPLAQSLKRHLPVGTLMVEDGPAGDAILTVATLRMEEFVPWLLACGDAVEVLEPASLRHEIRRIAQAMASRHG